MSNQKELNVKQSSCFYNYTFGLNITNIDLQATALSLLKSRIVRTIFFSDLKSLYLDEIGKINFEWVRPNGRQWDSSWNIEFSKNLPTHVFEDLIKSAEHSFHEQRIENTSSRQVPNYLRASLPPFVLEHDNLITPIHPWLKLYADGIMSISFHIDAECEDVSEKEFIEEVVNFFQFYFDRIWIRADLQRLDAELILPESFNQEFSLGGEILNTRESRKLIKEARKSSKKLIDDSLNKDGKSFEINGESWILHQIVGTENDEKWEATIDLCRSVYSNIVISHIEKNKKTKNKSSVKLMLWQGRPSLTLMRFENQPNCKDDLYKYFGLSLSKIMGRSFDLITPPPLPPDLRLFDDFSFHGNRSILLWTWLLPDNSPINAWDEPNTWTNLVSSQARAEHIEYHNMRIARACSLASSPDSDEDLINAYKDLCNAEAVINKSSNSGEISDALKYLIDSIGTTELISSGKEQARWHLDERRFLNEKRKIQVDRWLTSVFGIVGAAGLADLVIKPWIKSTYLHWSDWYIGLASFIGASVLISALAALISLVSSRHKE